MHFEGRGSEGITARELCRRAGRGDIVAVALPPYQFDAATPGEVNRAGRFLGQHGYRPDLVDLGHDVNMHLTPTIADLLAIPAPADTRGRVLSEILTG